MNDFFTSESDMQESQGQREDMEVEHTPPISYIDFFSRDNEVNMIDNQADPYIDFFAQRNQFNDVTDQVVNQPVQQLPDSFIDFFAQDDQANRVADRVADQRAQQSILYHDFFNADNQHDAAANIVDQSAWISNYFALVNQQRDGANVVEQSVLDIDHSAQENQFGAAASGGEQPVPDIDYSTPENQLCAAASGGAQPVPDIEYTALENPLNAASNAVELSVGNIYNNALENHSQNVDCYAPENQLSAAANVVEQSVGNIDHNAPENRSQNVDYYATGIHQLSAAADVVEQSVYENAAENQQNAAANVGGQLVHDIDYTALANHLNAAADLFEQSVGRNIDNYSHQNQSWNILYYDPENHRLGVAANVVDHAVRDFDYISVEIQTSRAGAANMAESTRNVDYMAVANEMRGAATALQSFQNTDYDDQPIEQINPEAIVISFVRRQDVDRNEGQSDRDEDAIPEFEQVPDDDPPFDEIPASRSVVRNLASVIFTQESVGRDTAACAVCMNEFNVGETAKMLPCSHYFHQECIFSWLDLRNTCPVCRYQLPVDNGPDNNRQENGTASPE